MLMVIFGAGASYDSDPARPAGGPTRGSGHHRPPLATQLVNEFYGEIANEYPASLAVIDYVRQRIGDGSNDTLETLLGHYAGRAERSDAARRSLIAFRFYLCKVITDMTRQWLSEANGYTVYVTLLNRLLEWQEDTGQHVKLVTFNYDTLLEDAAKRVLPYWNFTDLDAYVNRRDWGLLKLHGSISWSRTLEQRFPGGTTRNTERAMEAADEFVSPRLPFTMQNAVTAGDGVGSQVYLPGIAVPMANKTSFECEATQIEAFRNAMTDVDHLLICGWRAAEVHAVEILDAISPGYRLGIVTGGQQDLGEVQRNLGPVYSKGELVLTQTGGMSAFSKDMGSQLKPLLRSINEP